MSIAPPPPVYPPWPASPHPPAPPPRRRRRWPAVAAAACIGAVVAGAITALVTVTAIPHTGSKAPAAPPTITVTAAPAKPPTPQPAAQADKQTCHAWGTADTLVTAASVAQSVIPQGMTIIDPAVQTNPTWKAGVLQASELYAQAANTFAAQIAPGTSPMLAQIADTTVSALRTLSEAYKAFAPEAGNAVDVFKANQKAIDWLCEQ